jgi:hypothetical protein
MASTTGSANQWAHQQERGGRRAATTQDALPRPSRRQECPSRGHGGAVVRPRTPIESVGAAAKLQSNPSAAGLGRRHGGRENGGRPVQGSGDGGGATARGREKGGELRRRWVRTRREREDRVGFVWRGHLQLSVSQGFFLKSEPRRARAQKRCGRGRAGLRDTCPGVAVARSHESKRGEILRTLISVYASLDFKQWQRQTYKLVILPDPYLNYHYYYCYIINSMLV